LIVSGKPDLSAYGGGEREAELLELLKRLHEILRQEKYDSFKRLLPIAELFVDRWEKARFYGFGEGSSVYDSCVVLGDVKVGRNCWIGPNTLLDGSGGLEIGDDCDISAGSHIYTHDTIDRVIFGSDITKSPVRIGNHCYIGPHVIITKGVTIGDYVVIGANSLVNRDIPSYSKGWGTPFRIKGQSRDKM
jgi:acetyltransferase-like isoleucine patch superfamily enzyme